MKEAIGKVLALAIFVGAAVGFQWGLAYLLSWFLHLHFLTVFVVLWYTSITVQKVIDKCD